MFLYHYSLYVNVKWLLQNYPNRFRYSILLSIYVRMLVIKSVDGVCVNMLTYKHTIPLL